MTPPMDSTRTIYRYSYVFKDELGLVPPVRDSRAFQTEAEARKDAEDLQERGYGTVSYTHLDVYKRQELQKRSNRNT